MADIFQPCGEANLGLDWPQSNLLKSLMTCTRLCGHEACHIQACRTVDRSIVHLLTTTIDIELVCRHALGQWFCTMICHHRQWCCFIAYEEWVLMFGYLSYMFLQERRVQQHQTVQVPSHSPLMLLQCHELQYFSTEHRQDFQISFKLDCKQSRSVHDPDFQN